MESLIQDRPSLFPSPSRWLACGNPLQSSPSPSPGMQWLVFTRHTWDPYYPFGSSVHKNILPRVLNDHSGVSKFFFWQTWVNFLDEVDPILSGENQTLQWWTTCIVGTTNSALLSEYSTGERQAIRRWAEAEVIMIQNKQSSHMKMAKKKHLKFWNGLVKVQT